MRPSARIFFAIILVTGTAYIMISSFFVYCYWYPAGPLKSNPAIISDNSGPVFNECKNIENASMYLSYPLLWIVYKLSGHDTIIVHSYENSAQGNHSGLYGKRNLF